MPENLLQGASVRLTALTEDDLATIATWQQNAEFMRLFDAVPAYPKPKSSLKRWLEKLHKESTAFVFAVRPLDGDDLLGYAELDGILWTHGTGWLAIGIGDHANWGQGYGREAIKLMLGFAFNELNLYRVQLSVFSYNQRALALYKKLGFQREGTFREFLHRDGQRYDMFLYGLLRREWEQSAQEE